METEYKLNPNRQYVIGTAGHIDHGKTALVKVLTGIDTDKLPEEKERGITVNIGFAHFGDNITIIDVPGHERLIKNMVAGVSTIDLVLFVIAADDGVMPQTREHLDIVNLLGIRHAIFAITKTDLVDEEWLMLVEEDIGALLQHTAFADAPLLKTSASTGEGVEQLHNLIMQTLVRIPARQDFEVYRQPIDRAFSVKGFGTVITGTVLGGSIQSGDRVEIQPMGIAARVRGLQSHDKEVDKVLVGYRAAVNLTGPGLENIDRGMVLVQPELYQPVKIINARLTILQASPIPLKNNQRVRIHIHTVETFARVIIPHANHLKEGESALLQLRLEEPIHAAYQDRFIIRQYSPQRTIGGGIVLQTNSFRYRKKHFDLFQETLQRLESTEPTQLILAAFDRLNCTPLKLWDLKVATNLPLNDLQKYLKEMISRDELFSENISGKSYYFSREQLQTVQKGIENRLEEYHKKYPGRPGLAETEIVSQLEKFYPHEATRRAAQYGIQQKRLRRDKQYLRLTSFTPTLSAKETDAYRRLEESYRTALFTPPTIKEAMAQLNISAKEFKELIKLMRDEGTLIYVDETLLFHHIVFAKIKQMLRDYFNKKGEITVAEFKDLTGTTRKHSIPLLEYLDKTGITEREGDVRKAGAKLDKIMDD